MGDLSLGDLHLEMGEWDLTGEEELSLLEDSDFSPTMESIENPSFPLPLDEDNKL